MPLGEEAQHWLRALPRRGAAAAGRQARARAAVPDRQRRGADPAAVLAAGEAPCRRGRHRARRDQPARPAPQLRHPPAQPRRRPARAADAARPQLACRPPRSTRSSRASSSSSCTPSTIRAGEHCGHRPIAAGIRGPSARDAFARRVPQSGNRPSHRGRSNHFAPSPGTPMKRCSSSCSAPSACRPAPRPVRRPPPPSPVRRPARHGSAKRRGRRHARSPRARAVRKVNPQVHDRPDRRRADPGLPGSRSSAARSSTSATTAST